jgi:hypothetical protein
MILFCWVVMLQVGNNVSEENIVSICRAEDEDGHSMFLRNVGFYQQVQTEVKHPQSIDF